MGDIGLSSGPVRINAAQDEYLTRLVKLIPAEVVALYLSFKEVDSGWLGIFSLVCLGLVILVRTLGTSTTKPVRKPRQMKAVAISSVSFVLWVYAMDGYFLVQFAIPVGVISVAVAVWTFVVPYFYKGD